MILAREVREGDLLRADVDAAGGIVIRVVERDSADKAESGG